MVLLNERYQLNKELGRGGMGAVYQGVDTHTNSLVAVKECIVKGNNPNILKRIHREYYFMKNIKHPNVIRGLDFFQVNDKYFIVMEYVPGITLEDFIVKFPRVIDFDKQLQIAQQICSALTVLHDKGVIHRDIKPENIILTSKDFVPKLIDLGIAKSMSSELLQITKTQSLIGTPQYMSPEQIDPDLEVGENSDVFSLGIVLYQFFLWSPSSPFATGRMIATMKNVQKLELPPLFADVDDPKLKYFSQVIQLATHKEQTKRLDKMKTFLDLLSSRNFELRPSLPKTQRIRVSTQKYRRSLAERSQKDARHVKKKWLLIACSILLFSVIFTFVLRKSFKEDAKAQANFYFEQANTLFEQRKFSKAIEMYSKAVSLNPSDGLTYMNRGVCYRQQGDYDLALKDYLQAISLNFQTSAIFNNVSALYNTQKKYDLALKYSNLAVSKDPTNFKAYNNRGSVYYFLGKYDLALSDYDKVISLKPKQAHIYVNKGNIYNDKGEYDLAFVEYKKAVIIDPKYAKAHVGIGNLYLRKSQYFLALQSYEEAEKSAPWEASIYEYRGLLYSERKEYGLAIKEYNRSLELDSKNYDVYLDRALAYRYIKKYKQALQDYNYVLKLDKKNRRGYKYRGIVYVELKDYRKALDDFEKALALGSKDPNLKKWIAQIKQVLK
ncbi:tetratricopeptide repeat protein [Candidatus Uabimicrobium sp. HlEnr_7]|uniref:protein kinase domain-containing protein n=1 Tax=Candidatus Uabimicrobium helgolandensis TaxID=3095367 RepID=UPI0035586E69